MLGPRGCLLNEFNSMSLSGVSSMGKDTCALISKLGMNLG